MKQMQKQGAWSLEGVQAWTPAKLVCVCVKKPPQPLSGHQYHHITGPVGHLATALIWRRWKIGFAGLTELFSANCM